MITVIVADDQELVREGIAAILEAEADIDVVGSAADGAEALGLVHAVRPDVALMDIRMPEVDGVEATRRLVQGGSATRVLILTTFATDANVVGALRAGASGFLLKDAPKSSLLAAVRAVAAGDAMLDSSVLERARPRPPGPGSRTRATARTRATHRPRAGDPVPRRRWPVQRPDSHQGVPVIEHRQDPRRAHPHQARSARSHPPRDPGAHPRPCLSQRDSAARTRGDAARRVSCPPCGAETHSGDGPGSASLGRWSCDWRRA